MTTLPTVNDGKYGEIIKKVLRQHNLTYSQLEDLLKDRKITAPDGKMITKSRIGNWTVDRVNTPDWFMVALGKVIFGDERWWASYADESSRSVRIAVARRRIPMLSSAKLSDETIDVLGLIAAGTVSAVSLLNNLSRPHFSPRDLLIVDTSADQPADDAVYVIEEPENSLHLGATRRERLNCRKAVFDSDSMQLVMRAAGTRLPDVPASEVAISGLVVQVFEDWTLNTLARGRFDLSGQLFGEGW